MKIYKSKEYSLEDQIKNTKILISVLEAKIAKDEPEEVLDSFFQPCGTYGCVAGDTYLAMGNKDHGTIGKWNSFITSSHFSNFIDNFYDIFGFYDFFGVGGTGRVFGLLGEGSLEERLIYVKESLNTLVSRVDQTAV